MKWKWRDRTVPGITVCLFAVLLENAILIGQACYGLPRWNGSATVTIYSLIVAEVGALALIAFGVFILIRKADWRHEVDRELLDAFLEHIPDNVFFKDCDSRFVRISRAMANHFGLADPADAVNKTDSDIFSSEHAGQALADEQEIIRTGQPMIAKEEKETWPDGHETWAVTTKVPLKNKQGKIVGTMGMSHDITDRRQAEMQARYLALHDPLTGLPNRVLLEDRLSQAITLAGRNQKAVAVLLLDLDRFQNVNESFGHFIGDRLLETVAVRLNAGLRGCDTVSRLDSDQFVIVMTMLAAIEEVEPVARRVLAALSEPLEIEGHELRISCSIGISQFPRDGNNPVVLLQSASAAMYEAKKRRRGTSCFFSPGLTKSAIRQRQLECDLHHAWAREEFVVHYQPFVSTETGLVTGVEALLRWRHPTEGLISPSEFIPQLEELGLMVEVGRWVLRTACRQNVAWQQDGILPIRMAVNVSAQEVLYGDIVDTVKAALRETKLDPKWLELELTESRTLDDSVTPLKILLDLKRIGVGLALDDFGTGWSSLSYLRRFPIDRIKIDQSFIRGFASGPAAEAVVKGILDLGRSLRIPCIAEGVESLQQHYYLKRLKCPEMQGFLFSPPMTATDCSAMLRSAKCWSKADQCVFGNGVETEQPLRA